MKEQRFILLYPVREKRLKKYNRKWKLDLIEKLNPDWKDLYEELISGLPDQACPRLRSGVGQ